MAFPGTYNFNYYRGDTNQIVVRPKSSNGQSFDLTNYTALYRIANRRGSTGTQYSGTAAVDTVLDTITCTITPTVGRSLVPAVYVYDVQITKNTGEIYTVLTGTITVTDDISGAV